MALSLRQIFLILDLFQNLWRRQLYHYDFLCIILTCQHSHSVLIKRIWVHFKEGLQEGVKRIIVMRTLAIFQYFGSSFIVDRSKCLSIKKKKINYIHGDLTCTPAMLLLLLLYVIYYLVLEKTPFACGQWIVGMINNTLKYPWSKMFWFW